MRSPQITNSPWLTDKGRYGDLKVMQSPAGWYVGTEYRCTDDLGDYFEPGSRDTDYFATREEAEALLAQLEAGDPVALATLRMTP